MSEDADRQGRTTTAKRRRVYSVYAMLWRLLPGPWLVRALLAVGLFAAVVVVLFNWVFPLTAPYLPMDGTVGS